MDILFVGTFNVITMNNIFELNGLKVNVLQFVDRSNQYSKPLSKQTAFLQLSPTPSTSVNYTDCLYLILTIQLATVDHFN